MRNNTTAVVDQQGTLMTFVSLLGRLVESYYFGIGVFMGLQGYYAPNSVEEVVSLLLEAASQSQLAKLLACLLYTSDAADE